jgi:hypothetical protein
MKRIVMSEQINITTEDEKVKSPKWKSVVLLFGGTILLMIMVHAMQDAMYLQQDVNNKTKASLSGEVIAVSANALQSEYAANEDSTTIKYKDKQVLVTGKIEEIDKYPTGESFVILQKSNDAKNIKLQCAFKKEKTIDGLLKDQDITIQGTPNFIKNVILIENSQLKK